MTRLFERAVAPAVCADQHYLTADTISSCNNDNSPAAPSVLSRFAGIKSVLAGCALMAASCTASAASALSDISTAGALKNDTLQVTVAIAPPFVSITNNISDPAGIDIALIRELQRRTGFGLKQNAIDVTSFEAMMEMGKNGHSDILAGAISANADRARDFLLTPPYIYNSVCIVSRKGEDINTIAEVSGKTMAIQTGTKIEDMISAYPDIAVFATPSTFMNFYAVATGAADALITDEIIARAYIGLWPDANLEVSGRLPGTNSGMALMFKKDSPDSAILMAAYEEMIADGTVERIVHSELEKYFVRQVTDETGKRNLTSNGIPPQFMTIPENERPRNPDRS